MWLIASHPVATLRPSSSSPNSGTARRRGWGDRGPEEALLQPYHLWRCKVPGSSSCALRPSPRPSMLQIVFETQGGTLQFVPHSFYRARNWGSEKDVGVANVAGGPPIFFSLSPRSPADSLLPSNGFLHLSARGQPLASGTHSASRQNEPDGPGGYLFIA